METTASITFLVLSLALYFMPALVAKSQNHPHFAGILILNLFLGWTGFAWVVALVWAVTQPSRQQQEEGRNHQ